MFSAYMKCQLCPRGCKVNRENGQTGVCKVTSTLKVARAALHYWEETCISGTKGSGTVFFSGCSMHCVFCQNQEIAHGVSGKEITKERLAEIFLELQEKGANNINLVTPGQYLISFPKGIRANTASLKCCKPNGTPTIVMQKNNPSTAWLIAISMPPKTIQSILRNIDQQPICPFLSVTSCPNGHNERLAILNN